MSHDVVIAGAGPVGLFLACELGLAGASVLVLERAPNPYSVLKELPFGMRGLSAPSIDTLDRRGLLDAVMAQQADRVGADGKPPAAAHWLNLPRQPGGHFAGIPFHLDRVDLARWPYRPPGAADRSVVVTMASLERTLAARAEALGVQIRRGAGVDHIEPLDDSVVVRAGNDSYRGRWLVGCDGGRSTVRKRGGFAFPGTDPEFTGYSIQAELAPAHGLQAGRNYTFQGMYTFSGTGTIAMVDFDGGAAHRMQPITAAWVQAVLRRVSGTDVTVTTLQQASTWTDRARQASTYRSGRVLLAGDAAHIHSPLGGQGLNLGLGDAMNLGWKLAATLRGDAPAGLLDTYTTERHEPGARVLDWSRAQVALMRPSAASRALEAIVRDLIDTRDGATYFAERVWGVRLHHDLGPGHRLVGFGCPDIAFGDGSTVHDHLRKGQALLVDFGAHAPLAPLAQRWGARLAYVADAAADSFGMRAMFVRPDGMVAWATDVTAEHDEVRRAVARWLGEA
jgi:2-polyprenyl-6-methoxyphenol hydroxylase-like FAD-dependent oxidoreductase